MKVRVFLWGVLGGLWLVLILNYPLRGFIVDGTPPNRVAISAALMLAGLASIPAIGAIGSVLNGSSNRRNGMVAGAISGTMATLIAEGALGVIAAGAWGARYTLAQSLLGQVPECDLTLILAQGVSSTIVWASGSVLVATMLGVGLGALGGFFPRRPGVGGNEDLGPPMVLSIGGVIASVVSTLGIVVVLALLPGGISRGLAKCGAEAGFSPFILIALPLLSGLILVAIFQLLGLWCLLRVTPGGPVSRRLAVAVGLVCGLVPLLLIVTIILVRALPTATVAALGFVAIAAISFVTLRQTRRIHKQPEWSRPDLPRLDLPRAVVRVTALAAFVLAAMSTTGWLIAGAIPLIIAMTIVPAIAPLAAGTPLAHGASVTDLMNTPFLANFRVLRYAILGEALITAAVALAAFLVLRARERKAQGI